MGPLDPLRNLWEVLQQAPQLARQSLPNRDFVKGVGLGLSADVLGAPVDLMTMGMRPFGYEHPAPWGGSDWVAGKLGASPSNSPQETLGRVAGGLFTPDPTDLLKAGIVLGGPWEGSIRYHRMRADDPEVGVIDKVDFRRHQLGSETDVRAPGEKLTPIPEPSPSISAEAHVPTMLDYLGGRGLKAEAVPGKDTIRVLRLQGTPLERWEEIPRTWRDVYRAAHPQGHPYRTELPPRKPNVGLLGDLSGLENKMSELAKWFKEHADEMDQAAKERERLRLTLERSRPAGGIREVARETTGAESFLQRSENEAQFNPPLYDIQHVATQVGPMPPRKSIFAPWKHGPWRKLPPDYTDPFYDWPPR